MFTLPYINDYNQINYGENIKKRFQTSLQESYAKKTKKLLSKRSPDYSQKSTSPDNNSSLHSWIRQQGGGHTNTKISLLKSKPKHEYSFLIEKDINNFNNRTGTTNTIISTTTNKTSNTTSVLRSNTPRPNSFHQKCIDDVLKSNEPKNHYINDPKELVYIKSLPYLKLSILGIGKTNKCLWELKNIE
jgi:hypothetical protein